MTIEELCEGIGLPPHITEQVRLNADHFDFRFLDVLQKDFYDYESARKIHTVIEPICGDDPNHTKILSCMLYMSAFTYDIYQEKGILDEIYFATMKCYSRFLLETFRRTGQWRFDRFWWTARQAGAHLFRIGELEYEIRRFPEHVTIGIHIPSDANLLPPAVDASLDSARCFFASYYPEVSECDYICHSWLMDTQLRQLLSAPSNILNFQKRFHIYDMGEESEDAFSWIFQTEKKRIEDFPEATALQRSTKEFLLAGGVLRDSYGLLR